MYKKIFIILLVVLFAPTVASSLIATTLPETNVLANGATFNGNVAAVVGSADYWFEYGTNPASLNLKTPTETTTIAIPFSSVQEGTQFMAGTTYYYRAVASSGGVTVYGVTIESFTTSSITQVANHDFDAHFNELITSNFNLSNMTSVGAAPYTDVFGQIFWGFIFSLIFVMLWIRQEDVTIPSLLGFVIGGSIWTLMPPEWVSFAMSLTVISLFGIAYSLIKGRN